MYGRLINTVLVAAAAALLVVPFAPAGELEAQDETGRFTVLVPDFLPAEGTDDDFGKDTAEKIRDALHQLATHAPLEKDEIEDMLDQFDLRMRDLDCLGTRQLGGQMRAQIAFCGTYEEVADKQVRVQVSIWNLESQLAYDLEPFTMSEDDDEAAAAHIMASFDRYNEAQNQRTYCFQYASERAFDDALRNCNLVLESSPEDVGVLKQKARIYMEQADPDGDRQDYDLDILAEALPFAEQAAALDPADQDGLQLAGFIATTLGEAERGREHYRAYLRLSPGDVGVRRRVAYEMYEAGDPRGAMQFVEEGLEVGEDPDLQVDLGNYAFAAARNEASASAAEDSGGVTPEVAELYTKAINAYIEAFRVKGAEMATAPLRNVINAYIQLDQTAEAVDVAEEVLEAHPDDVGVMRAYATALQREGRLDDALSAMARVEEEQGDDPRIYALQGTWLLDVGRLEEAVAKFKEAIERGQDPRSLYRSIFAEGHRAGTQEGELDEAIEYVVTAKTEFQVTPEDREELDFWHGWFVMKKGEAIQAPSTLQSARAALPVFREARGLLAGASSYAGRQGVNHTELMTAVDQYIAIQEAIIKRGGGRL